MKLIENGKLRMENENNSQFSTLNSQLLGDYIQEVNIRNTDLSVDTLLGVSIQKVLMPSIANTIGTNMKTYKIIRKNQFIYGAVTSRNGDKISIALLEDYDEAIVSQAYTVFEITDTEKLLPEYLMMWFRRPEFDRYARYKSHGSARETFDWQEMCEVELPIPSIEKQREIVNEYNTVVNRIKLNDKLNQKLEETTQTLYKHWFVDFEFPNEKGLPYQSNGGEMVYNEELDREIPKRWSVKGLSEIADYLNGTAMQKYPTNSDSKYISVLKIRELNQGFSDEKSDKANFDFPKKYLIKNEDIIFSWSGTLIIDIWTGGNSALNQHLFKVTSDNKPKWFYYLATKYYISKFIRIADGNKTSLGHIKREHLNNSFVAFNDDFIKKWNSKFEIILKEVINNKLQNQRLRELKDLLLARMSEN